MMLADKVSAEEAERTGMIYKCFTDEMFSDESIKIANVLAQMPTEALALTKEALNHSLNTTLELQLLKEDELQRKAAATYDYNEGVQSFLEKRKPMFKGK